MPRLSCGDAPQSDGESGCASRRRLVVLLRLANLPEFKPLLQPVIAKDKVRSRPIFPTCA
jgi:hypothetical protein